MATATDVVEWLVGSQARVPGTSSVIEWSLQVGPVIEGLAWVKRIPHQAASACAQQQYPQPQAQHHSQHSSQHSYHRGTNTLPPVTTPSSAASVWQQVVVGLVGNQAEWLHRELKDHCSCEWQPGGVGGSSAARTGSGGSAGTGDLPVAFCVRLDTRALQALAAWMNESYRGDEGGDVEEEQRGGHGRAQAAEENVEDEGESDVDDDEEESEWQRRRRAGESQNHDAENDRYDERYHHPARHDRRYGDPSDVRDEEEPASPS